MNILIVGASGGIGNGILRSLLGADADKDLAIYATYRSSVPTEHDERVTWLPLNAADEKQIAQLAGQLPPLNWVLNCAGVLHTQSVAPEKSIGQFTADAFAYLVQVNTLPSLLLAKHLSSNLKGADNVVFATVSAKVGSITDNRLGGWYSYRISKAALNMALKTLSIEWQRTMPNVCVAALHPGTTATKLSKPFQKNVPPAKLFVADKTAQYLLSVIRQLTPDKTGQFWSWDGSTLPW